MEKKARAESQFRADSWAKRTAFDSTVVICPLTPYNPRNRVAAELAQAGVPSWRNGVRRKRAKGMPGFTFLTVREADPELKADPDGLLYPIPGQQTNQVVMEPRDGSNLMRFTAKRAVIRDITHGSGRDLSSVKDVRIDVVVTDARVTFACSKYDKGGGWVGGASVMIVANTVSKARAAIRRHGKMLVGQVRYPWLSAVGGSPKEGFLSDERLRFVVATEDKTLLALDLTLPKDITSAAVAAEVAKRAARFRLACNDAQIGEARADFESLEEAKPLAGSKDKYALHNVPNAWWVTADSARLDPALAPA